MDPSKVFQSQEEKEAFDKYVQSLLPMDLAQAELKVAAALAPHVENPEDLEGKTREELLAMLPPELRMMVEQPKGWFRSTGKTRKLLKQEPKYLYKHPEHGLKRMARKV